MTNLADTLRACHATVWGHYAATGEKTMDTERALLSAFAELGCAVDASLNEGGDAVACLADVAMMLLTAMGPTARVTDIDAGNLTHAWPQYALEMAGVMQMATGTAWADYNLTQLLARIATHDGMDLPTRLVSRLERIKAKQGHGELAAFWPDMEGIPDGRDVFAQYPISGTPAAKSEDELADAMNRHNRVPGWRPGEEYGDAPAQP